MPGLAVAQEVGNIHDVISNLRSLKEAPMKGVRGEEKSAESCKEQLEHGDRFRRLGQARELYARLAAEEKLKSQGKLIPIRPDTK